MNQNVPTTRKKPAKIIKPWNVLHIDRMESLDSGARLEAGDLESAKSLENHLNLVSISAVRIAIYSAFLQLGIF